MYAGDVGAYGPTKRFSIGAWRAWLVYDMLTYFCRFTILCSRDTSFWDSDSLSTQDSGEVAMGEGEISTSFMDLCDGGVSRRKKKKRQIGREGCDGKRRKKKKLKDERKIKEQGKGKARVTSKQAKQSKKRKGSLWSCVRMRKP